jgi:hypothetical protein
MTNDEIKAYATSVVELMDNGIMTEAATKYVTDNPVTDPKDQQEVMDAINTMLIASATPVEAPKDVEAPVEGSNESAAKAESVEETVIEV